MHFSSILIPVDFSVNTEVAVQKGLDLCEAPDPTIHLLHALGPSTASFFRGYHGWTRRSPLRRDDRLRKTRYRLEQLAETIRRQRPGLRVTCSIIQDSSVEKAIVKKAEEVLPDLIIIGKNSQHSLLPFLNTVVPARIINKTGAPVLTVKPGCLDQVLRMVVVPIGIQFPEKKIAVINSLRKKFGVHIRLLIVLEQNDNAELLQASLVNICRVLKTGSTDNLSYEVLPVQHKAADILRYCRRVGADLLIVHPESEDRVGWMNKHISDELPVQSRTQVLAIS